MKSILIAALMILLMGGSSFAQEYTANYWASTTSVSNATQTQWPFPFKSRSITIMNGSTIPIWVSFGTTNSIAQNGTTTVLNQVSNGNNKAFMLPNAQWTTFANVVQNGINLRSTAADASPVTVIVTY